MGRWSTETKQNPKSEWKPLRGNRIEWPDTLELRAAVALHDRGYKDAVYVTGWNSGSTIWEYDGRRLIVTADGVVKDSIPTGGSK